MLKLILISAAILGLSQGRLYTSPNDDQLIRELILQHEDDMGSAAKKVPSLRHNLPVVRAKLLQNILEI